MTTDANDLVGRVHDRMPVILGEDALDAWMMPSGDNADLLKLLVAAPEDRLIATPVSPRANSVKNDDPGVVEEVVTAQLI